MRSAAPAQPARSSGPWSATAPASATANWPGPGAVAVLATGASQPPGPPQRCKAHPARATPAQPWCETPRKESPGSGPSPVARPRPTQAGQQAAATRICLQLSTLGACLFADGTRISRAVPANGIRRCSWSRIAGLRVQSRHRNRSGAALPFSYSVFLPAPAVIPATTPHPPASAPARSAGVRQGRSRRHRPGKSQQPAARKTAASPP